MIDYASDIEKFTSHVDEHAVDEITKHLGIALHGRDSALVSATDPEELERIRDGFARKRLGLSPEAADAGIRSVVERMSGDAMKNRVTFYYLLAEVTGTLDRLTGS